MSHSLRIEERLSMSLSILSATPGYWTSSIHHHTVKECVVSTHVPVSSWPPLSHREELPCGLDLWRQQPGEDGQTPSPAVSSLFPSLPLRHATCTDGKIAYWDGDPVPYMVRYRHSYIPPSAKMAWSQHCSLLYQTPSELAQEQELHLHTHTHTHTHTHRGVERMHVQLVSLQIQVQSIQVSLWIIYTNTSFLTICVPSTFLPTNRAAKQEY